MDTGLIARAKDGDEAAFAAIIQASHGRFKQIAYRVLRDPYLAEDAMQQAMLEMWRKLPTLRDPEKFDGWSYRFLVNACYREAKRHKEAFRELPGLIEHGLPDASGDINDRDQLERGFQRLSMDHRSVVVMHYYLDLTIEDTAEALGISAGTATSRLNRAKARLRLALQADAPRASLPKSERAA